MFYCKSYFDSMEVFWCCIYVSFDVLQCLVCANKIKECAFLKNGSACPNIAFPDKPSADSLLLHLCTFVQVTSNYFCI
ncbi:hypothetical protein XENTR_v10021757 [Xenopus tropicalis]|nr:hypothetical protein XENTR_v10021757 [Xenopus tropicalis]